MASVYASHTLHAQAAPGTPDALRNDPDAILAAREALLADGAHLHGPEIAARLGVPEAAIMAARLGRDTVELAADLPALLAPLASWSKLLLAARAEFGVALCLGRFAPPTLAEGSLRIENHEHRIAVAMAAVDRVYLLHESDPMHGRSVSLNAFDGTGEAVLRVYLMSKEGRDVAAPHFAAFGLCPTARRWQPRTAASSAGANGVILAAPETRTRATETLTRAILGWPRLAGGVFALETPTLRLRTVAQTMTSSHTPPTVHATGAGLKLHLRPEAATTQQRVDRAGTCALRFLGANGDALELSAAHQPDFERWVGTLATLDGVCAGTEGEAG